MSARWRSASERCGGDGACRDARAVESVGHEPGVVDSDAEAEGAHPLRVADLVADGGDDFGSPEVARRVEVGQLGDVVPGAPPPRDAGQVGAVVEPEVVERGEQALF